MSEHDFEAWADRVRELAKFQKSRQSREITGTVLLDLHAWLHDWAQGAANLRLRPKAWYVVQVPQAQSILPHDHPEYIALWYLQDSVLGVEDEEGERLVWCPKWSTRLVEPGVVHWVPKHDEYEPRLSVAMKLTRKTEGDSQ